ncbi:hypothetical protein NKR23_g10524 [Pleurostoma richardsiae]|uniref:Uncharacterized protein n=1 Tax=Pleurostoma richardsiae TaxID=41990 RepID=A0AA38R2S8_9PEZI|nr:hypothetical protein NKR23_g10524 [Pleurostoma richardsiae]
MALRCWGVKREPPKHPSTKPCPELRHKRFRDLVEYLKTLEDIEKLAVKQTHPDEVERAYMASGWKTPECSAESCGVQQRATEDKIARSTQTTTGSDMAEQVAPHQEEEGCAKGPVTHVRDKEDEGDNECVCSMSSPAGCKYSGVPAMSMASDLTSTLPSLPPGDKTEPVSVHAAACPALTSTYNVDVLELTKFLNHKAGMECCWSKADYSITEWKKHEGSKGRWDRVAEIERMTTSRRRAGLKSPADLIEFSIKKKNPGPSKLRDGWTPGDWDWERAQEDAAQKQNWSWKRENCGRCVHRL